MRRSLWWEVISWLLVLAVAAGVLIRVLAGGGNDLQPHESLDQVTALTQNRTVTEYAKRNGLDYSSYPQSLIELLERNPEAETFVLEYPLEYDKMHDVDMDEYADAQEVPLLLQWDQRWGYIEYGDDVAGITACGPMCLSMAAYYVTRDPAMSPDQIIRFALDNGFYAQGIGSEWTLISEGGEMLGLDVTEIPLVKDRVFDNLEVDNPIICAMGPGDFTTSGHFIVMTGCEDGMICINDPNSKERSEQLWSYEQIEDQIRNLWVIREG